MLRCLNDQPFQIRERRDGLKEAWTVVGPDNGRLKGSRYARTKAQVRLFF